MRLEFDEKAADSAATAIAIAAVIAMISGLFYVLWTEGWKAIFVGIFIFGVIGGPSIYGLLVGTLKAFQRDV